MAKGLNDAENYRTDEDYDDNLMSKKFLFEIVNAYGAVIFTIFFKGAYFICADDGPGNDCARAAGAPRTRWFPLEQWKG